MSTPKHTLFDFLPEGAEILATVHDAVTIQLPMGASYENRVNRTLPPPPVFELEMSFDAELADKWVSEIKAGDTEELTPELIADHTQAMADFDATHIPYTPSLSRWPVLYTKGKKGELRSWQVSVEGDKVIAEHGVVGGAINRSERKCKPKNVGRSNATTAETQALKEAAADHKFMLDRKYSLTPEDAEEMVPLPMLAKKFKDAKNVQYPVDVQRKLDGVRAIARWEGDRVALISRQGIPWERVQHLNKALESILPRGSEFDGEIYLHGKTLQQITQIVKNLKHPDNSKLEYHVYDMPTANKQDDLPWSERREQLTNAFADAAPYKGQILQTITYRANSPKEVQEYHDRFVKEGYEGAIIRILIGVYEYGYRSDNLLKLKAFEDHEFEIIGFKESDGEPGLVKWVCRNDIDDQVFETRPRGTHADRRWLFQNGDKFVGKKLTVVHFGRYDSGLPHFPIGKAIRVEEDL